MRRVRRPRRFLNDIRPPAGRRQWTHIAGKASVPPGRIFTLTNWLIMLYFGELGSFLFFLPVGGIIGRQFFT